MNKQPQFKSLADFRDYCLTVSQNCGDSLYALIWFLVATKTELKMRLKVSREEASGWQREAVDGREKIAVLERRVLALEKRNSALRQRL